MNVSLVKAKNGETTATYNNLYLHSLYNPTKEAERFVENINCSYIPPYIIISEPGIGYSIPLLKEKFPQSKIIIVRYCLDFNKFNNQGDLSYYYNDFSNKIINDIGEENLINSLFLQWPPSSQIFKEIESQFLIDVKKSFENAKTLLVTREFFEKKWFFNSIKFIKYANNFITLNNKIEKPILIISSGPSLSPLLKDLASVKDNFFIICLSSAIKVCIYNNIIPDLAISTDGGYWAGQHLKSLYKYNIPIALPPEGYLQNDLLKKLLILPLNYGDGLSSNILKKANIKYIKAERNGTVSGTALEFALNNSTKNIYFAGLDMSGQTGFQHCQPNENEINNSIKDNRFNNNEKRAVSGEYSKGVLDIYKEWFQEKKLSERKVFRIINNENKKNSLGEIKDISVSDFIKNIEINTIENNYISKINQNKDLNEVMSYINDEYLSDNWQKSLFPLSMCSLIHNKDNNEIVNRLQKENKILMEKIKKVLYD